MAVLKRRKAGVAVAEILRKHGISGNTSLNWKSKCGGATISELRRQRAL
jgi:putative transposase